MCPRSAAFVCLFVTVLIANGEAKQFTARQEDELVLDLLRNYDGRFGPHIYNTTNGKSQPTVVAVNTFVRTIEDVDISSMTWKTQLTFRMQWTDPRLQYRNLTTTSMAPRYLTVPIDHHSKMWLPDIFFSNERDYKRHVGIRDNSYFRIFPNGEVLYSLRITLDLNCPMVLKMFPFSQITCSIRLASYGHTKDDIVLIWKPTDPVQVTSSLFLPDFRLTRFETDYCDSMTNTGVYSCLRIDFLFKQESSRFCRNVFLPMCLALAVIWLAMWIDLEHNFVSRSIFIWGSFIYMKWTVGNDLLLRNLKVSYDTAFDCWNLGCNVLIGFAFLETVVAKGLMANPAQHVHQGEIPGHKEMRAWQKKSWGRKLEILSRAVFPLAIIAFVVYYTRTYIGVNE